MRGFWRADRRRRWGILLLTSLALAAAGATTPARRALTDADHFFGYYRALDRATVRPNFWNRVALSLAWTSAERHDSCIAPTSSSARPSW
jgi:hypothetical protein